EECFDDAAAEGEQRDRGCGENCELPGLGGGVRECGGGAEACADRGGARAVEERACAGVLAHSFEAAAAEQDERKRGGECDGGGDQAAGEAVGGISDRR